MKSWFSLINKKNIILLIFIVLLIIIVFLLLGLTRNHKQKNIDKSLIYTAEDSSISVTLSEKMNFSKIESDSYKLALYSSSLDSGIYFSELEAHNIRDIYKFINADKNDYISKFSSISQVSDISETVVCGEKAYNYNFYYKSTMYVDVYWVLKDDKFIVIDFNIDTENTDLSIIKNSLDSLTIN